MANNPRKKKQGEIHRELSQKQNKSNQRKGPIDCITIEGTEYFYTKCQLAQIKENKTSTIIHNCFLVLYHINQKYAIGVVLEQSGFPNKDRRPSFYLLSHLSLSRQTRIRYERNCLYLTIDERKQIVFYFDSSKITEEWKKKILNCQPKTIQMKMEQKMIQNNQVEIHCDKNMEQMKNAFSENRIQFKIVEGRECFYTKCLFVQIKGKNLSTTKHNGLLFLSYNHQQYKIGLVTEYSGFLQEDRHPEFLQSSHVVFSRQTRVNFEEKVIKLQIDKNKRIQFSLRSEKIVEEWEQKISNCKYQIEEKQMEQRLFQRLKKNIENESSHIQSVLIQRIQQNQGQIYQLRTKLALLQPMFEEKQDSISRLNSLQRRIKRIQQNQVQFHRLQKKVANLQKVVEESQDQISKLKAQKKEQKLRSEQEYNKFLKILQQKSFQQMEQDNELNELAHENPPEQQRNQSSLNSKMQLNSPQESKSFPENSPEQIKNQSFVNSKMQLNSPQESESLIELSTRIEQLRIQIVNDEPTS